MGGIRCEKVFHLTTQKHIDKLGGLRYNAYNKKMKEVVYD